MDLKLKGRVAVITGASKGIGAAIAKTMAAEGASVVVNFAESREGAARVVTEIVSNGGKAIAIQGDVSKIVDIKRIFEESKSNFGAIDILVNNAGVGKFGPAESVLEEEFHRQFNTNVLGTVLAIQEALKHFPETGGSIINISSVASQNPGPYTGVYAASKAAIEALTLAYAKEFATRKIRVNTIAPGSTETEGARALINVMGKELENAMIAATPMGRFGTPEEIASVVVFLASDAAKWVTGERIKVSGGLN
ncbi:SDR family NAD(P)-dependent oxidoreductase [Dyadobacter sp. CY326]|uniref:SDR family NAD(P)-dependent oxidoreductase n=1 Tax=Dyadobacter sp. CY326 TaxID=2907300 RepID=UPI001F2A8103|nr:glucose 1-dehydrogenase [Dyadobacter sp. CY326]MCE7067189.1 glucose 1-dehydrogenase [Dyadobacter sp. CY326]